LKNRARKHQRIGAPRKPDGADTQYSQGKALARQDNIASAIEAYQRAIVLAPRRVDIHLTLAKALDDQHRFQEAAAILRQVLELRPPDRQAQDLQVRLELGAVLHKAGDLKAATNVYVRALQLKPDCAEGLTNLGVVCQDLGDLALAAELQRQAIAFAPTLAEAHNNLGSVLSQQGHTEDALACYRKALALQRNYAGAQHNIGLVFEQRGDLATAEEHYRSALASNPQSGTLQFYLSVLQLLQGKFTEGWEQYESRWNSRYLREGKRNFTQPQWRGESLAGQTILLHAEQGLGDTLQFVRYAPLVAARGAHVVLEVQPGLRRLISGMHGDIELLSKGDPLPAFEWHCPLMSLPLAFKTELVSIPAPVPYLQARDDDKEAWRQRLPASGLRIGLVWAGDPKHSREAMRSIPLAQLTSLTALEGTHFYSLQKGAGVSQLRNLSTATAIVDLDADQKDFADTAAIVANLDLVISIDTSVAHLAGALGKPVWVLLNHLPDWRWLMDREDSPWYPTARLFRKSVKEDWPAVIDRVRQQLEEFVMQRAKKHSLTWVGSAPIS
jgi:tetratricopeptide (TPR) repeat protein